MLLQVKEGESVITSEGVDVNTLGTDCYYK